VPVSRERTVAADSMRVLGAQIAANTGWFVAVLLLARGLTTSGRGTVAFVTVAALLTPRVAMAGAGEAAKVLAATRPDLRAVLLANLAALTAAAAVAGGGIAVAALILAPGARPAGVGTAELALLAVGVVAVAGNQAAGSYLQGRGRFQAFARMVAIGPWLYTALLVVEWLRGPLTVPGALGAWVVAQALPTVLLWAACLLDAGIARPQRALLRESISFGVRAWAGSLAYLLNARLDQIIVGVIATEATLGVYAVAVNACEVLYLLPTAVASALLPAIARAPDAERAARTLRIFRAVALVTLAGAGLAVLLGPVLVPAVFGEAYRASVTPLLLLLPSALGFAASTVFSNALLASSAPGRSSAGPLTSLVVGVVLDLALVPSAGAAGAAVAASAALLCGGAAAAYAFGRRAGLSPAAVLPSRTDLALLAAPARQLRSRLITRRAGARWS
jgi:O-antigen/teichoic acid export membrane protein